MADYFIKLELLAADFYDNLDDNVEEIWQDYKYKWFFPRYRKRQIEKALFMSYLAYKAMIRETYSKQ